MVQVIPAHQLNIIDLNTKFGLNRAEDDTFFIEWRDNLPEISSLEKQMLDPIEASYLNLVEH